MKVRYRRPYNLYLQKLKLALLQETYAKITWENTKGKAIPKVFSCLEEILK
jgi:hypothetical protein